MCDIAFIFVFVIVFWEILTKVGKMLNLPQTVKLKMKKATLLQQWKGYVSWEDSVPNAMVLSTIVKLRTSYNFQSIYFFLILSIS